MTVYISTFNGLCNRLIPLLSVMRHKDRKIKVLWTGNPGRASLTYMGETCNFSDLFIVPQQLEFLGDDFFAHKEGKDYYEFDYRKLTKNIVDFESKNDIYIMLAIHAIFSSKDNPEDYVQYRLESGGRFNKDIPYLEMQKVARTLKPVQYIQNEIEKTSKNFTSKMIGIHVRRTDGSFSDDSWYKTDDRLLERMGEWISKGYKIFLSTDSVVHERRIKAMLGNDVLTYCAPGNKFQNNKFNTICGLIEIYLLSKCNTCLIGTKKSSFSLCASLFSEYDNVPFWYTTEDPKSVDNIDFGKN